MFFATHYAENWFNPWNEKWYAGFSQATYPPLTHQWIALFSHVMGVQLAYMFVQLCVLLLLPVGVYRYARLWVDEYAAKLAAVGAVFLGSLAMLVYQAGQLPTTFAAALTLNALPFFYDWTRTGRSSALLKGFLIAMAAAAGHHVTFLFGMSLFAWPVLWLAVMDRRSEQTASSTGGVIFRAIAFALVAGIAVAVVLLPYWITLMNNPITQMPIPHGSRDNYLLNPFSGLNFWLIPHGAMLLALPFIFLRGSSERRLRPLFFGWFLTLVIGLGGTTPVARLLLGRAFEVLTFERFTFWATLMAMPFVGLLAAELIVRFQRKAAFGLSLAAIATFAMAVSWTTFRPNFNSDFSVDQVISFLNNEDHAKFRYITLGFGNQFSKVSRQVKATSVDGDYNSARLLPELTAYGSGKLDNAKYFGTSGMESLRAILKHGNQYGLKYVFVRDPYYEPLLNFAGWRPVENYDRGAITLWAKDDIQPVRPTEAPLLPFWQRMLWGLLPILSSVLALLAVLLIPERRRMAEPVEFPVAAHEPVILREAR
jgi:hypothetical protein